MFNLVRLSIRLLIISTTNCEALHKQPPNFVLSSILCILCTEFHIKVVANENSGHHAMKMDLDSPALHNVFTSC